jgi:hypothetical protein
VLTIGAVIDRPHRLARVPRLAAVLGLALMAGPVLAACGGTHPDVPVQVSSVSCQTSFATATGVVTQSCVFILSDGKRFSCPQAFARTTQTPAGLERAKACTRLKSLPIPTSSRRVFAVIESVRSCLTSRSLRVAGGPVLGAAANGPQTPLGELIVVHGNAPTFIAFYKSHDAAQRAEPMVIQNARRLGGVVARHGAVTVLWSRPPAGPQRAAVEACGFM